MIDHTGQPVPQPGDMPTLSQMAACCALCNDSTLSYAPEKAFVPPSPRSGGPMHAPNVGEASALAPTGLCMSQATLCLASSEPRPAPLNAPSDFRILLCDAGRSLSKDRRVY